MSLDPARIRRWAVRVEALSSQTNRDDLAAIADMSAASVDIEITMGAVLGDLDRRKRSRARYDVAIDRVDLIDDLRLAARRGWWETFCVLAPKAFGVRVLGATG